MIKNLIFDFGDVFIDLDKSAPADYFSRFDILKIDDKMNQVNLDYEKGLLTSEEFTEYYIKRFPRLNHITFKTVWNSIIQYFPQQRLDWIINLAETKKYRLFLLSNTNDLHIEQVIKNMDISRYSKFKACFEGFYLSQEIHLRKPDAEIFQFILDKDKLKPSETLFIDDLEQNTKTAAGLGLHTWTLQPGKQDITTLFNVKKDLFR